MKINVICTVHLVDVEYFFYRLILDAYRVISNVSLYGSGSFVGGWVRVRFWCCGSCEMANRCGICRKSSAKLQETVKNPWQNHKESTWCVVRPIWDAEKGTHVYQTQNYKVTQETIPDASTLDIDDINWTIIPPLPSGIGHTPQPKLSGTPVRCTTAQKVPFDV